MISSEVLVSARANCSGLWDTFRMSGGSLFHWFGPDTEKPRRPNLSVLARGTIRSLCVCLSVCVLVTEVSCAKSAEPDRATDSCRPNELCIRWGQDPPRQAAIFSIVRPTEKKTLGFSVAVYTAKRIIQSSVPARHAMRPFVKILWPLVAFNEVTLSVSIVLLVLF